MTMANTDNKQAKITSINSSVNNFVASSKTNEATSSAEEIKSIQNRVMKSEAPLLKYFDLAEDANYSYVLGYN